MYPAATLMSYFLAYYLIISIHVYGSIQIVLHGRYLYDFNLFPTYLWQKEGSFEPTVESHVFQTV